LRFDSAHLQENAPNRGGFQPALGEARFNTKVRQQPTGRSACYASRPNLNPASSRTVMTRCQGSGAGRVGILVDVNR
jgi:hypothetical protein